MQPFAALFALAGVAAAYGDSLIVQNYDGNDNAILRHAADIPVCANLCIFQAAVAVGCQTDDYQCQCGHRRLQLHSLTENCLAKSCNPDQSAKAHQLTDSICAEVENGVGNPDFKRRPAPAPFAEAVPAPFPAPAPAPEAIAFPAPEDAFPAPDNAFPAPAPTPAARVGFLEGGGAVADRHWARKRDVGSFALSPTGSSIASSIVPATGTSLPTAVATAGAAMHRPMAAVVAGAGAVAVAALLW